MSLASTLAETLSNLYPTRADLSRVVSDAGIDPARRIIRLLLIESGIELSYVPLTGNATTNWQSGRVFSWADSGGFPQ